MFQINRGVVTPKSSKKKTVVDSMYESKYIAASEATKEGTWLKNFIGDIIIVPNINNPMEICCDSESAVTLTKEPKDKGKSRHILNKYHYIRCVKDGDIIMNIVSSKENPFDCFTKLLLRPKHDSQTRSIGMRLASDMV